jgi:hypothetical protein
MDILRRAAERLKVEGAFPYGYEGGRRIHIGEAELSEGWTDGLSFVAINRTFLAQRQPDLAGLTAVGLLLVHEACHGENSFREHDHDQAFYERFHDALNASLPQFLAEAVTAVRASASRLNRQLKRKIDDLDGSQRQLLAVKTGRHFDPVAPDNHK